MTGKTVAAATRHDLRRARGALGWAGSLTKDDCAMADTPETTKSKLTPANENPWYCLMTLHGEQPEWATGDRYDRELHAKNRLDWNRWAARALVDDERKTLLEAKDSDGKPRFSPEELTPHSEEEWVELAATFTTRAGKFRDLVMQDPDQNIVLSKTKFDCLLITRGFIFPANIDFSGTAFSCDVNLSDAIFLGRTDLSCVTFYGTANLTGAIFDKNVDLKFSTFSGDAKLSRVTFSKSCNLRGAIFSGITDLKGASFSGGALFLSATFSGSFHLSNAAFSGNVNLSGATFSDYADLSGAAFSGWATFNDAKFSRKHRATFEKATFGGATSFLNAELEGDTSFARAIFKTHPPSFHGAKLNEGTAFDGVTWPDSPPVPVKPGNTKKDKEAKVRDDLEADIKNYQRLKQMMETLKKHEDELDFFAKEMACKQALHRGNGETGKAWLLEMYGTLSDYGRSVLRPLVWLGFVVWASFVGLLASGNCAEATCGTIERGKAFALSATSALGFLPMKKEIFANLDSLSPAAHGFMAANTVLSFILLFLAGLGLRNRFRMK